MKTVGVIGGLGPEATAKFYLELINKFSQVNKINYPSIVIYNIPLTFKIEQQFHEEKIDKKDRAAMFNSIFSGVKKLEKAGVDLLVIPCNTVHIFTTELRQQISVPFLSIIEETAKRLLEMKIKKVGLLGTKITINSNLYQEELKAKGIDLILPDLKQQSKVLEITKNILFGKNNEESKKELILIINSLALKDAKAIILGCTEIPLLMKQKDVNLPLIDTIEVLAESTANKIIT